MLRPALFVLAFSLPLALSAQRGLQLGLRAFPQFTAQLNSDDMDTYDFVISGGVAGGVMAGYGFTNHIALELNALYSSQGQTWITETYTDPVDNSENDVRLERRLRYIQLPLLFKLSTDAERKYSFFGQIGPQFGLLVGAKWEDNDRRYLPEFPPYSQVANYPDEEDRYLSYDLSGVLAAGVDIKLRFNLRMHLALRASMSLLDIEDKDASYNLRVNGEESEPTFWASDRGATRNLNAGLMLGFTYIFIPKFHY